MKQKRIILISTEFPPSPGGIGSHAYYLIKELQKLGWEVTVATEQNYAIDSEITSFNQDSTYPIFRLLPTPSIYLLVKKIAFLISLVFKQNPSIIIGTGKHGSWFAYLIARITFKKCVLIGHGTEFTVTMSKRSSTINRWVFSKCDALICVSNYTRQIVKCIGIKNKNALVIHNGADAELFKKLPPSEIINLKNKLAIANKKVILTVGNVSDRKGQEWVIRALPVVIPKVPNAHYYCVGMPSLQKKLEKIASEIGVKEHVHFLGKLNLNEVVDWMNSADIFAMTSAMIQGDFEGFGIAVIEAALCGKPAVITNQSGLAEAIVEGKTGLGVNEKDSVNIAEKIILLLTDEEKRNEMGINAKNHANNNLTWTIVAQRYDRVFNTLI